ncbi:MAG TPA: diphosphate--fructose-6-phosphate 1-phosphotransferase [Bryobacteraceae bacterium]|jgi:6-phosphofructokinase 1|nr:diphosphate--fructose-6-phosphate 1-phosphotransferase [Bryobacteraceae bacterium]
MPAALLVHSGGPTPVINASLLGVVEQARQYSQITALLGARFGLEGILNQDFIDLFGVAQNKLEQIAHTPSSTLGSSRRDASQDDIENIFEILRAHDIRYMFYNGGNGSMGTANLLATVARKASFDIQVVGIPKTIDNDIAVTDHTPGFASTARLFACAVRDIGADNRALPGQVEFVEVLGRNAGWIVAATTLARHSPGDPPHLVYFPEERLPLDQLLADIDGVFTRYGRCVVAVCEGQLDSHGQPFGADVRHGSRGSLAMNLGHRLAMLTAQHLGLKTRSEKPGLLGRSSSLVVENDWNEARLCGQAAVDAAIDGQGGNMITLVRDPRGEYQVATGLVDLQRVAGMERLIPADWRKPNGISADFRAYLQPLIGPIEPIVSL